ncbi:hypothetical protein GFL39_11700 [Rhizobium leguminosarum bv. viciae]|uniref:hypothetical protein n=1 Tax=Rhizobium leguminosarum TaxID=384 RepID=UPI001441225E|nr:hypothetical protein [Rhizobium leguminosarum]NKL05608.1 hypothetical protein [Rhizobium leguminosarum bv. viciae]
MITEKAAEPVPPSIEERDMMAAHERLERELIRVVASEPGATVSLAIDGQMSFPLTNGRLGTIGELQFRAFSSSLVQRGLALRVEGTFPRVEITLTEAGRSFLTSTPFFLKVEARVPRKPKGRKDVPVATSDNIPDPAAIMRAVVQALAAGEPRRQGKLLPVVSELLGYPLDLACAGKPVEGQKLVQRNFSRAMDALGRVSVVTKQGKSLRLTPVAKAKLKSGKLRLPRIVPNGDFKKKQPSEAASVSGRSNTELLAMWKNAIKMLANPLSRASHSAAEKTIRDVTLEWERRTVEMDEGRFPWPSTEAKGGNGLLSLSNAIPEGMLAFLEYRVGRVQGEPEAVRRGILARVFESALPPVFPKSYMADWGAKGSPARLQKMAVSIAAFVRNNKRRRNGDFSDAIREWESDLDWLYRTYYVGRFRFASGWPETSV